MDNPPELVLETKIRLEKMLADSESHVDEVVPQKIGTTWAFKIFTSHEPERKPTYFERFPLIFEKTRRKLSKRESL